MLRLLRAATFVVAIGSAAIVSAREPVATIPLWPDKPPGPAVELPPESDTSKPGTGLVAGKPIIRLGNVSVPTLSIFLPPEEKRTGAAMVICPGGGYGILAFDLEGTEVAEWFAERGVACFVLKYRVPRRNDLKPNYLHSLQDGQRAISVVRNRASQWNLDPKRIGILGFSAGGNLAGTTAIHSAERRYEPIDAVDKVSSRPDFAVLVYPAYFVKNTKGQKDPPPDELEDDVKITKETPPMFLVHAGNDGVPATNSVLLYLALKKAGVSGELHIYPTGGHGYGIRPTEHPVTHWHERCYDWLAASGWLKK